MAQQGKQDDVEFTLVLLAVIFAVLMWGMWSVFKQPLVEAIRWVKGTELAVVQFIDPSVAEDRNILMKLKNDQATIRQIKDQAANAKRTIPIETWIQGNMLAPEVLWVISNRAGEYTRYPLILFLIGAAVY